jgi:Ca2+-dependent lipid-binding protein
MPSILKVKIINARDLPVMDRSTDLTDAFVEIRFGSLEPHRTAICRRTLSPVWNEDFRFEVSNDSDLQNEPLEIKVLDYDYGVLYNTNKISI